MADPTTPAPSGTPSNAPANTGGQSTEPAASPPQTPPTKPAAPAIPITGKQASLADCLKMNKKVKDIPMHKTVPVSQHEMARRAKEIRENNAMAQAREATQ